MKRQLSQKLVVKYNGRTLLNKRYMFARPAQGFCFVDWASEGITLEVCYQKVIQRQSANDRCRSVVRIELAHDKYF